MTLKQKKYFPDNSPYILRDLSWLEFNDRVMQEGLNSQLPLGERLRFLAIVSSNLDEYFKVRVASAKQRVASASFCSSFEEISDQDLLKKISLRSHQLVQEQTEGILACMKELSEYGINLLRYQELSPKDKKYLRTIFETNILPVLTPMAVEDLSPSPLLPSLQLHVALWLRIPVTTENHFNKSASSPPPVSQKISPETENEISFSGEDEKSKIPGAISRKGAKTGGKTKKKNPENSNENLGKNKKTSSKKGAALLEVSQTSLELNPNEFSEAQKHDGPSDSSYMEKLAVIPVPTHLSRLVMLSEEGNAANYVFLEEIIAENADLLFPGCEVLASAIFRITRDEDVIIRDQEMEDMTKTIRDAVLSRKRRNAVRLEISAKTDPRIERKLLEMLSLTDADVYTNSALLDATIFFELARFPALKKACYEDWPAVHAYDLMETDNIMETVATRDVMLFHPYEKFDPVIELLQTAAEDPDVLAIKQTLYRTSGDSSIVKALKKAATNGKEVVVLVELKARFDEAQNVEWALQLENAGCHVIYGVVGLKTHAKAMLIVRRQHGRIQRYVHLSTGNYNEKTAKLYSDIGLMTAHPEITADVAAFFNLLTGYSEVVGWNRLTVEPFRLKRRFLELIDREIDFSSPEHPGRIRMKLNSLEDTDMINKLYEASQHGVKIDINVRGICCLRPGIPGLSENIHVRSIIDRYLEHARIFEFLNGGHPELYLSSADWMTRNLERRLEIIFPVLSPVIRHRLSNMLDIYFADNVKAQILYPDGHWEKVFSEAGEEPIRAQQMIYEECVANSTASAHPPLRYIPLRHKEKD
ncbi:MAG: polyphosphate kinase 1 [Planctomycetia bacterium]|nr:polyphosphate kinase 1 [Planctomycetia bacterium]